MNVDTTFTHKTSPRDNSPHAGREISAFPELETIELIALADIDESERLRPIDPLIAQAIAASYVKDGQLQAVDICSLANQASGKPFRLVFGGHRLEAARLAGWSHIKAIVRSSNALDRKAREVAENIFKGDLSPLDRAAFVSELYAVEKARAGVSVEGDGRAHSANVRWQKALKEQASDATAMIAGAYGMQGAVAQKIGMSERTVRNDLLLHRRLSPSLIERVRVLSIGSNASALRKLAGLDPDQQVKAVTLMEDGQAKGVSDALAIIQKKPPVDADTKRLSTFLDTFGRMGKREQRIALETLQARAPKACQFTFNDQQPTPAISSAAPAELAQQPAVPIRRSVHSDYVVCLEDGRKFKSMTRHLLRNYNMSPAEYRAKWGLPQDYPMTAPNHARERDRLKSQLGLRAGGNR